MKKTEESKDKEKKVKPKFALEKFKLSIDMLQFEATVLWQIFTAYLLANTIILGFLTSGLFKDENTLKSSIFIIIGSLFGLIISILWFRTFKTNSDWYYFRMHEQAKIAEKNFVKSIKDNNWFLLNKAAEKVAKNQPCCKNKHAGSFLIIVFIIIYATIIIYSIFNIYCDC